MGPHRAQARRGVLELGDLDLEPRLARRRTRREDVEDELAPIEHLAGDRLLDRANCDVTCDDAANHCARDEDRQ